MELTYVKGDATRPAGDDVRIICHICNDIGGWGRGFVVAISKRWPEPEAAFRAWFAAEEGAPFALGETQFVQVEPNLWVANMIAQRDIHRSRDPKPLPPIRYEALERCLGTLAERAVELGASIHMPRIGCGLAGGKWPEVRALVEKQLCSRDLAVTVYDFG